MHTNVIIVAAGSSQRLGRDKVTAHLGDKRVIEYSLEVFQNHPEIGSIVIVGSASNINTLIEISKKFLKVCSIVRGGSFRAESVKNGFDELVLNTSKYTLIHNAANPFVTSEEIDELIKALQNVDAVSVGHVVHDTIKKVGSDDMVSETLDRSQLRAMQTPQGFRTEVLTRQYNQHGVQDLTDELQLVEKSGGTILIVPASINNFKITTEADMRRARSLVALPSILMGIGEDSHRFSETGVLILGGIEIPSCPKLLGNSDADVILHAIFNAISSAIGGKSLGSTADSMCENGIADSKEYLKVLMTEVTKRGYRVTQVSLSLECARPKIDPVSDDMKEIISLLLDIHPSRIGITATTGEALTSFGKGEGIRVSCLVQLAIIS